MQQKQREEQIRRLDDVQQHITEALATLTTIDGWAEHSATIRLYLERAGKKARDLEQRMRGTR
jgi:hypothetical protein